MQKKKSFYIFCVIFAAFTVVCVWGIIAMHRATSLDSELGPELGIVELNVAPASQQLSQNLHKRTPAMHFRAPDYGKLNESLADGATPTQDVGERGSLNGALLTKNKITYHESKYERLPDSPLYIFTDDMIWPQGEHTFAAKKEALSDQSKHLQEASIALSVSPRVEYGKTTGFRLVEIPENTLFSKMGMVSGDIIVSINGALPDIEPMALMFVRMAAGKQGKSTIVVDHAGVERTIDLVAVE